MVRLNGEDRILESNAREHQNKAFCNDLLTFFLESFAC